MLAPCSKDLGLRDTVCWRIQREQENRKSIRSEATSRGKAGGGHVPRSHNGLVVAVSWPGEGALVGAQLSWLCVYSPKCGKHTITGWGKDGQATGLLAACATDHIGAIAGSMGGVRAFPHSFPRSEQLTWALGERCHVLGADMASPPAPARDKAPAGAQARCGGTAVCSPQVLSSPGR